MKIAIALFGIPRASDQALPTLFGTALGELGQLGETRVFHHLFVQPRVRNPRSSEDHELNASAYTPFTAFDGELEPAGDCLQHWPVARLKASGDYYRDDFHSFSNLIHQLHSLWRVTQWIESWQPDVVLFLRPDLIYHDAIPLAWVEAALRAPRLVVVPDWQWWGGVNDRLALCGRDSYSVYGRRIEQAVRFCEHTGSALHAERLLRFVLSEARLRLRTRALRASRIRTDGRIVDEKFYVAGTVGSRADRLLHLRARWLPL